MSIKIITTIYPGDVELQVNDIHQKPCNVIGCENFAVYLMDEELHNKHRIVYRLCEVHDKEYRTM